MSKFSKQRGELNKTADDMGLKIVEVRGYLVKINETNRHNTGEFCQTLDDVNLYLRLVKQREQAFIDNGSAS